MKLLIDFLNVKSWTVDELLTLFKRHSIKWSVAGYAQGYENHFDSKAFPGRLFFLERSSFCDDLIESGVDVVTPDDIEGYDRFFNHFEDVIQEWFERMGRTVKDGPDVDILNQTMKIARIGVSNDKNPWVAELTYQGGDAFFIEDVLALDYLKTFVEGQGSVIKKARLCKNPQCFSWFIYNRPKQLYCCDTCRLGHHNKKRVQSGEHAAYQRKMRKINPASYR
jgi:uncharacterized protein YlaI